MPVKALAAGRAWENDFPLSLNLPFADWLTLHGLVTALAVLVYAATSHAMPQRRDPTAAIAWMLFIVLIPYVALPAFLTFGTRKLQIRRKAVRPPWAASAMQDWVVDTLLALGQPAPAAYESLHVHADGGESRDALLAMLKDAQHSIDVCTFILGRDRVGSAILDLLSEKARAGVRVRLLVDGLGEWLAPRPDLRSLSAAGGAHALFAPPLRAALHGRSNLRQHRKLAVADAGTAAAHLWCGGRNLTSEYFEGEPGAAPWHDLTFDLGGALVAQAAAMFERDWAFANGRAAGMRAATSAPAPATNGAQLVASGPDQVDDSIYALLVSGAYRAERRIALATPYFVPDSALLAALCLAAKRGVSVDLLIPKKSNHRLSDLARSRALRSISQAGARIWLAPGMLHGKLAIFDDNLALAGSANLDSRSLFVNYEMMVAFRRSADVGRFASWFEKERACARRSVPARAGILRDLGDGLLLWMTFQL
jgi:cardiolipin synthase A/B